jgi:expansin (peptidoglycan-binding protein)
VSKREQAYDHIVTGKRTATVKSINTRGLKVEDSPVEFDFQHIHRLLNQLTYLLSLPIMKSITALLTLFSVSISVSAASVDLSERAGPKHYGSGTWYDITTGYTACGARHNAGEFVVAVSAARYDATAVDGNPNHNTICGRQIRIDGPSVHGPVYAKIVDRCEACAYDDIDMTASLFQNVVGDLSTGRANIVWHF